MRERALSPDERPRQRGQAIALFTVALAALVLGAAVVVDGGYAFAQRRAAQNAADFAAMAGTRIVGVALTGQPPGAGTARNVEDAIASVLSANGAELVGARYVDEEGRLLGSVVGAGAIPAGAFGVVVEARTDWQPFLLGAIGVSAWEATATATAMTSGQSAGGGVLPVGIQDVVFDSLVDCPLTGLHDCLDQGLTSGSLNIPGGFGWLTFGLQGEGDHCDWVSSLGMLADGGCQVNQPFLDSQIGPPAETHGCCMAVGEDGSEDKIGSLTGNEWGDLSFYIDNRIPVWLPIWDHAGGSGANAWYHIVGFGAIIFTGQGTQHARWLEGAALDVACAVDGQRYCEAPGGPFTIEATGQVRLIR